ncbi:hypothetical protein K2X30_08425 [bacterium]|nr:hypothetical protein [bacterium]
MKMLSCFTIVLGMFLLVPYAQGTEWVFYSIQKYGEPGKDADPQYSVGMKGGNSFESFVLRESELQFILDKYKLSNPADLASKGVSFSNGESSPQNALLKLKSQAVSESAKTKAVQEKMVSAFAKFQCPEFEASPSNFEVFSHFMYENETWMTYLKREVQSLSPNKGSKIEPTKADSSLGGSQGILGAKFYLIKNDTRQMKVRISKTSPHVRCDPPKDMKSGRADPGGDGSGSSAGTAEVGG